MIKKILLVLSIGLFILSCSEEPSSEQKKVSVPIKSEPNHIWKNQVKMLDKAKNVEATLQKSLDRRKEDLGD